MRVSVASCLILAALLGSIIGLWVRGPVWRLKFALGDATQSKSVGVISRDGKLCSILCRDHEIRVFETGSGRLVAILKDPFRFAESGKKNPEIEMRKPIRFEEGIFQMYFSSDNKTLRVDYIDGGYEEWSSYTGEPLGGQMNGIFEKLEPILVSGGNMVVIKEGKAYLYVHSRPEHWWGIAWLPEFWLTVVFGIALIWSLRRDWKTLRRKKVMEKEVVEPHGNDA